MKKMIAIIITITIFTTSQNVYASDLGYKEESIYGLLQEDGHVDTLYVVNALYQMTEDFGNYDQIDNLSSLDLITIDNGKIILPNYDDLFYYQGTINQGDLPWDFDIAYTLDGKDVTTQDLAGASGELVIHIKTDQGDLSQDVFYKNFALQVTLVLSDDLCKNIEADGATMVEVGGNKQIAFTVLPGQIGDMQISATIKDFEMDPITINGVNMIFDMDFNTDALTGQLQTLSDSIADLDDGAIELLEGLTELSEGLETYTQGMSNYSDGMAAFVDGGANLSQGVNDLADGLTQLQLQNDSLKIGVSAIETATFQQINLQLLTMGLELPPLTVDNYKVILGSNDALNELLLQVEETLQLTQGLVSYIEGVDTIASGASDLSLGVDTFIDSADTLALSAKDLYDASVGINDGLSELRNGMVTYQSGTDLFRTSTSNMSTEMEMQIGSMLDDFTGSKESIGSFVSDQNTQVASVQFFLRTPGINKVINETPVEEPVKTYTLWEKILKLFGLLKDE